MQAVELARRHGWSDHQAAGVAYTVLGSVTVGQGRLDEAEQWLKLASQTLRSEAEPAAAIGLHHARVLLELARGRDEEALREYQAAERLADKLVTPHTGAPRMRARILQGRVRLGQTEHVETAIAGLDEEEQASIEMRTTLAALRLTQHNPQAAASALAPVLDNPVPGYHAAWMVTAALLEAEARDQLGDADASRRALQRALDIAGPDRLLIPFLIHPAPRLLERHFGYGTAHGSLVGEILDLLTGKSAAPRGEPAPLLEPLSESETRILRYLPTNLTIHEIANELYLSVNTIKTHVRHLYFKLDTHSRSEAVDRARTLGLLARSSHLPR
jgi:LuxR family maltose regulon positive regulatory protein